ncbi:MAG TPA: maleylpyruvate isomerase family mycothiol-dependent enzyme [Nocardioides sp.]|nr:maleylpyruvate isomerase family mycothiol-dependent enzyme [Nocardioides sp.]
MTTSDEPVIVLSRALDQAGDVLAGVRRDQLSEPTPCGDWTVEQLIAHLLAAPGKFITMASGGEPDWSAAPPPVPEDWVGAFRSSADDLIHLWHQKDNGEGADWQTAEFAVHTWDLATATGHSAALDAEVAERALAFMSQGLTPDNRGEAFGPEVSVPDDAPVYDRLAAFAGRDPS